MSGRFSYWCFKVLSNILSNAACWAFQSSFFLTTATVLSGADLEDLVQNSGDRRKLESDRSMLRRFCAVVRACSSEGLVL